MDKSKINSYRSDEEARKNISKFELDWDYNALEYSAVHKTGFKLALRQDEDEDLVIVSQNFADWAYHMSHDEKLTGHEIATYKAKLVTEFQVLTEQNHQRMSTFVAFKSYITEQTVKNRYKS